MSIKDLASRCQLAWLPLAEADAAAVQAVYQQLFREQGPPLVLKSDNGGPFRDAGTKTLLAAHQVLPLYSPTRRPSYNGGVERANGQLAGYQEALAQARGRPGLPTCEDAESARCLANDLARRDGLGGPTAQELWAARPPVPPAARAVFLAAVEERRVAARAAWNFAPEELLTHYQQAAVDRRAVRDALVAHDLLHILPRCSGQAALPCRATLPASLVASVGRSAAGEGAAQTSRAKNRAAAMLSPQSAGRIHLSDRASSMVDEATNRAEPPAHTVPSITEEAASSTNKSSASGQHYG